MSYHPHPPIGPGGPVSYNGQVYQHAATTQLPLLHPQSPHGLPHVGAAAAPFYAPQMPVSPTPVYAPTQASLYAAPSVANYAPVAPYPGVVSTSPFSPTMSTSVPTSPTRHLFHQPSIHGGFSPVVAVTSPLPSHALPLLPGAAASGVVSTPSSVVALRFRGRKLKTADALSESDPFVVVYLDEGTNRWRELGRTETVVNSADPTFTTVIEVDYFFEEVQRLRVEVFDRDSKSEQLHKHDFLGCAEFTMAQLMSSTGQSLALALLSGAKQVSGIKGHIIVDGEELSSCGDHVTVEFGVDKADAKNGWFGKSDPFLNIYQLKNALADPNLAASWLHVWRSPQIMDSLNPRWPKVTLSIRTLCNGDLQRKLKFECMDWEASGRHQFIGSCMVTAGEFVSGEKTSIPLINAERQAKKGKKYVNSGVLRILSIDSFKLATFAEYLRGGCEIGLIVGIDFTASNGAFTDPNGLHFISNPALGQLNNYQSAITAIGAILEPYDPFRRFAVYGFGALVNGAVNHCFSLTFDPSRPDVEGVGGILNAYTSSLPFISLHGPTNFAPLIRQAATIASTFQKPTSSMQSLRYYVLLIITDGAIMDMDNTIEEIVSAAELPLSIVIVGVGDADFSAMDALDADGKHLRSPSGRTATRDIVQFVPFNTFRRNPTRLTKETLAEIPLQLAHHFRARGVKPNPPLRHARTEMLIANATVAAHGEMSSSRRTSQHPNVAI